MTTIRDAVAALHLHDADDGVAVLAVYTDPDQGVPDHHYLDDIGDQDVTAYRAVYVASGLFRPGSIAGNRGRTNDNCTKVEWLTLDADLKDYVGIDAEALWELDQADLDDMVTGQARVLTDILGRLGVPVHRIVYTGYGICIHVRIRDGAGDAVPLLPSLHKALIRKVNAMAGDRLVDPQASDAGARITRVPGSLNTKGAVPREVRIMVEDRLTPAVTPAALATLVGDEARDRAPVRPLLTTDKTMPGDMEAEIVAAVAPHWTLGQKHSLSLALAGMLAKAGVEEAQALRIVEALSADDTKPWDRRKSVADSYARVRAGLDTRGYHGLLDYLPQPTVAFIDERLQQVRQASKPGAVVTFGGRGLQLADAASHTDPDAVHDLEPAPIPDVCLQGWLARYVEMMLPLTEAPESFHLGAAMSLAGATFGRRLGAKYISKALYANQYIMLIGVAGDSRKDTAIEFAIDLPSRHGPMGPAHRPFEIATDIGSAEGLIGMLSKSANLLLYITEYERLSQNAKRKSTSTIIPTLTAAWNAPNVLQTGTREETNLQAKLPTLSVIAAVQPEILTNEMTANEMNSGYASRWLFVPGRSDRVIPDPPDIDERAAHNLYVEIGKRADGYGHASAAGSMVLDLSSDARERWHEWYIADRRRKERMPDLEAAVASRLAVHIRKVALLYAGLDGAREIELRHLESGIAFVEWSWSHTQQLMQTWGATFWTQIEERIQAVLRKRGPMKRRDLTNQCRNRKWGSREFAQVLEAMIRNGTVAVDLEGNHAMAA